MRLISRFLQNQSRKNQNKQTKKKGTKNTIFRDSWKFSGNFPRVLKYCCFGSFGFFGVGFFCFFWFWLYKTGMRLISRFLQNQSRKKQKNKQTPKNKRTKNNNISGLLEIQWQFSKSPKILFLFWFFCFFWFCFFWFCFFCFFFGFVFLVFPGLASEDFERDFPWVVLDSFH